LNCQLVTVGKRVSTSRRQALVSICWRRQLSMMVEMIAPRSPTPAWPVNNQFISIAIDRVLSMTLCENFPTA